MRTSLIALGIAPLAALAVSAGPALAGGAVGATTSPTPAQTTAILKAGGVTGPASCYTVLLSARRQTIAGAKFNQRIKRCATYAFDGAERVQRPEGAGGRSRLAGHDPVRLHHEVPEHRLTGLVRRGDPAGRGCCPWHRPQVRRS